ncbi:MAG: hypothetical protein ABIV63_02390 [Caldimonas sp.]
MKIVFRCDPALIDLLPRPVAAREALPEWLRGLPPRVHSAVHQRDIRTVKQCPPFVDAMMHGFVMPLPCDVEVRDGRFSWSWSLPPLSASRHPRAPLSFHVPEQIAGTPLEHAQQSALKFNSFWTVELEPGWSLMAVHPINRDDLPFRLVTGLVEADTFHQVGINFPAVWTDKSFSGTLNRGTPIAQCFAVPRGAQELVIEAMSAAHCAAYEETASRIQAGPGVYRRLRRNSRAPR